MQDRQRIQFSGAFVPFAGLFAHMLAILHAFGQPPKSALTQPPNIADISRRPDSIPLTLPSA